MSGCGRQQRDAPVTVHLIVPVEDPAAEVEAVVIAGESVGEVWPVLEGLELAFGEGIVVADVGSAIRLGDAEGGQELGNGVGLHIWATVAVDRELITMDAFLDERLADQSFGQMLGFPVGEHPVHDVPAVDVEDHVEVAVGPLCQPSELCDVRGPDLIRGGGHEPRNGVGGVAQLIVAFPDLLIGLEDTVHRADGAEIGALIQKIRVDFGRGLVGEWLAVEDIEHLLVFLYAQGARRRRPWLGDRGSFGLSMPVDGRPRHATDVPIAGASSSIAFKALSRSRLAAVQSPGSRKVFLDVENGLCPTQLPHELRVLPNQSLVLGHEFRIRIGLPTATLGHQAGKSCLVVLLSPHGQVRQVETFTPQQRPELPGLGELICLPEDARLVFGVEPSPYEPFRHRQIRPLLPVDLCPRSTHSRPFGGRCTQHSVDLHLLTSWPSTVIGKGQVSHLALVQRASRSPSAEPDQKSLPIQIVS